MSEENNDAATPVADDAAAAPADAPATEGEAPKEGEAPAAE